MTQEQVQKVSTDSRGGLDANVSQEIKVISKVLFVSKGAVNHSAQHRAWATKFTQAQFNASGRGWTLLPLIATLKDSSHPSPSARHPRGVKLAAILRSELRKSAGLTNTPRLSSAEKTRSSKSFRIKVFTSPSLTGTGWSGEPDTEAAGG